MQRSSNHMIFRAGFLPLVAATSMLLVPVSSVQAQQRMVARSFVGGGGGGGAGNQIGARSIEKYSKILDLTPEQKDTVKQLHEGYQAAYTEATKAMQAEMEEAGRAFQDTQDHTIFAERIPAARKKFKEQTTKAESEFFSDLKQVLTEPQTGRWDRLERARRRETLLRGGSISGDSVDLIEVVEGLKLPDQPKPVAEALEQYESDLDRALLAKKSLLDKQGENGFNPGRIDLSEMQKRSAEAKEAGGKIKQVNQDHARRIEQLLPEESRSAFSVAVKRQTFPSVFKPSQVTKALDSALLLSDLDAGQRETLKSLKESYAREVAPFNDAWAAAIEQDEQDPSNMSLGDESMSIRISGGPGGDEEESALAKARKARREFDDRIRERMKSTLTPAQREKLPKTPPAGTPDEEIEESGVFVSGGPAVFVTK